MLKRLLIPALIFCVANRCLAQKYTPVPSESVVEFKVKNFGINVGGNFGEIEGHIVFSAQQLQNAVFDVKIKTESLHTGINQRDNHVRSDDFLDVAKFPFMYFVSTKVTKSTNQSYLYVFGKLTIKDVTKEISFPFKATPQNGDMIFEGEFSLNRRDYHVGKGSLTMGDIVKVNLRVKAKASP